jgi:SAM-dependent methyltransferase
MPQDPWQLQLLRKSLKKKEKLALLEKTLDIDPKRRALDLGCAQGVLSYYLRRKRGFWVSTDQDWTNLVTARGLIEDDLVQIGAGVLPFKDASFDLVACLDYLEHLDDDDQCLDEIRRVLKEGGQLILVTPHTGKLFVLHKLRSALGLKLDFFGHKREGYSLPQIRDKLDKAHLRFLRSKTYSRFFTEFLELGLNFVFIKLLAPQTGERLRDGHIKPGTSAEFVSHKKSFRIYSLVYPLVWLVSRLDKLLFFLKGYSLMVWAKKNPRSGEGRDML